MADPRNVIVEIKNGLSDVRQQMNLLKQETQSWANTLGTGLSKLQTAGSGGGSIGGVSSNQVAPNPKFTPPSSATATSNTVANGSANSGGSASGGGGSGSGGSSAQAGGGGGGGGGSNYSGNTSLTRYITENASAGFLYTAAVTSGAIDKPGESVEAQLLMSRTGYFNGKSYDQINKTQGLLAAASTTKDKMDVMRGLAAAQSIGVTGPNVTQGAGGMGSVASGVASVSNLLPGAGFEGTMRAYGSMQQGRNVNMLRGIGIQLRDSNGNMKPPDQIIDDLWKKICRDYAGAYGAGKTPSEREVLIGLQPGNSMDSMLDMYFGNDPMAKQLVANGLLYKAKTKGASIDKATLTELGGTTAAVNAQSYRNAAGAVQTGATAEAGAKGYASAATALGDFSLTITEKFLPQMKALTETNAKVLTYMGAANDTGKKGLALMLTKGGILATAALALGLAATDIGLVTGLGIEGANADTGTTGGATGGATGGSTSGSSSTVGNNPRDFAVALLKKIGAPTTKENIDAMVIWMKKEGGAWKNSASYNPLNTGYQMPGSVNFKSKEEGRGVQAYTSVDQGLDATYNTLTGNQSKARGYDKIVELFKAGAPKEAIFAALSQSSWDEARYKGVDWSKISADYNVGSKATTGASSAASTNTVNYGGVTFNVTGNDPEAIAKAIKEYFNETVVLAGAANK